MYDSVPIKPHIPHLKLIIVNKYLKPGINEYNVTDPNPDKPEIKICKHLLILKLGQINFKFSF